jgi:hypothetical protein
VAAGRSGVGATLCHVQEGLKTVDLVTGIVVALSTLRKAAGCCDAPRADSGSRHFLEVRFTCWLTISFMPPPI